MDRHWIGIPYLMLIATGILMNIPADLYESARIDGANAMQMYGKITLPYMLFVTGPYLLTSFTGNINNFNVIFLLSQGKPMGLAGNAGYTDLLITWLYRMTVTDTNYKIAAVIGINRHQLQDRRRHRHHGVRGAGRDQPGGLQPDTVRQE